MYLLAYFLSSLCVCVVLVWYMPWVGARREEGICCPVSLFSAFPWRRSLTEPGVRLHPLNPSDPPASALLHAPPTPLHPSTHSTGVRPEFLCNCRYLNSGPLAQVASTHSACSSSSPRKLKRAACSIRKQYASNDGSKYDLVHEKAAEGRIVTTLGRF